MTVYWSSDWMSSVSRSDDFRVETIMVVSSVFYRTNSTIRFHERIFAFNDIPITSFVLGFMISSMSIFHTIFVLVFRMSLQRKLLISIELFESWWTYVVIDVFFALSAFVSSIPSITSITMTGSSYDDRSSVDRMKISVSEGRSVSSA